MRRHPHFGLVAPEHGWFPAPRYLLRRARVLELVGRLPVGRLLEVGCGAGALLDDLAGTGWECDALETSGPALEVARAIHRGSPRVRIHASPGADWRGRFDLLTAFEVLEHVEDAAGALRQWTDWLAAGGRALLSVPAHRRRWGPSDVWAGHFRRYDRDDLLELVRGAGLVPERLECYGFPLANLVDPVRNRSHRRRLAAAGVDAGRDRAALTAQSGVDRRLEARLFPIEAYPPGSWLIRSLLRVQKHFLDREWGNGYLILARKPSPGAA
jgi:SAM-dependent methyltransferase